MQFLNDNAYYPFSEAKNFILMGSFEKLREMKQYNISHKAILEKPFSIKTLQNTVKKKITLYHT